MHLCPSPRLRKGLKSIPYFWKIYICFAKGGLFIWLRRNLGFLAAREKISYMICSGLKMQVKQLLTTGWKPQLSLKQRPPSIPQKSSQSEFSVVTRWGPASCERHPTPRARAIPSWESAGHGKQLHRGEQWDGGQDSSLWSGAGSQLSHRRAQQICTTRACLQNWGQNTCGSRHCHCPRASRAQGLQTLTIAALWE